MIVLWPPANVPLPVKTSFPLTVPPPPKAPDSTALPLAGLGEKLSFEGNVIVNLLPAVIAAVLSPGTSSPASAPPGQVKFTKFT